MITRGKKRKLISDATVKKTDTNDSYATKSDGISLALGSEGYKEMIYDNLGVSEIEQVSGKVSIDDAKGQFKAEGKGHDGWHDKVSEKLIEDSEILSNKVKGSITKSANVRTSSRAMRTAQLESMLSSALKSALVTESQFDDRFVKDDLLTVLKEEVHNDASGDDFYPGSKVLNKYQ